MNDRKKNRPRGRPKVSGVCKLSKAVTVKFSKIDYERLCRRSRQANLTLAEFLRVSAFETTITARHSAEETAVIRSLTGMANNLNQLTRLAHAQGFAAVAVRHATLQAELVRMIEALRRDR